MERRAIVIRGIVQGVGFRPFVYSLAARLSLGGFVKNQTGSVLIEVEGEPLALNRFLTELAAQPPPLSQIDQVTWGQEAPKGERRFHIESSAADPSGDIFISPDVATCKDCLAELLDPADRRFGYPFLNCTNCGPRLTIIKGAPYDRQRTTMAAFPMCNACRAEYEDPANRRFHAQPTACAACGPRLRLVGASGEALKGDPLAAFVDALRRGKIGALKGLGGYHLVCDAQNPSAVQELRWRKHRDEKPFAIMVQDVDAANVVGEVQATEHDLLASPACPIVLLRKRQPNPVADEVAPGNPYLGVMLPATPLHHLLVRAMAGLPLVMTSGNRSEEPIAYVDDLAARDLGGIADLFLMHDRPIHVRCDDSVTRVVDGVELPVRRSRGYAPRPIALPRACPFPIFAVGGQLKGTFALGRERQAFLSHHMGDLDHYEAFRAFVKDVALYQDLFGMRPECVVHDLHPDYATTRYALAQSEQPGIKLLAVQHHHAHMASCMAENGLDEPVIGVSFDGTGLGTDGAMWGGEFLIGDYLHFRRAAHLRYVGMPGGDQAIRQPWRMAVAHCEDAKVTCRAQAARLSQMQMGTIAKMLERGLNSPLTSSVGRLFDAVAALAGLRQQVSYEGQAAVELEWLASAVPPAGSYPFDLVQEPGALENTLIVDSRPLVRAIVQDVDAATAPAVVARRFHGTLADMVSAVCGRLRKASGLEAVVLSGGVFLNALLTHEVYSRLSKEGFRVYRHRRVPPNDGGLSLGQLAIAARQCALALDFPKGNDHVPRDSRQGDDDVPRTRCAHGKG
jgi:hydrogenase maturation protein HypF